MVKTVSHNQSDGIPIRCSNDTRMFCKSNLVSMFEESVVANQSAVGKRWRKQGSSGKYKLEVGASR
jgi:hypothetical protein